MDQCRGSGNYSSDKDKEIVRLKRQLRDAEGAIEVLKKAISNFRILKITYCFSGR